MKRIAYLAATAAIAAAAGLPAVAHGPQGHDTGGIGYGQGSYEGMMEMMHEFAERGGPGMMGGGYGGPGMMMGGGYGGPGMMRAHGMPGLGLMGGMGHFGMSGGMFDDVDANGDGLVTADEARAAHTARLEEFDADGDDTLSIDEFERLHSAAIRELMVDRFQHLDADGDGQVTQDEMNGPIDRMSRFMRMQERYGTGMGYRDDDDDADRPGQHMDDDDMPRRGMDDDDMRGMGGGGMMRN